MSEELIKHWDSTIKQLNEAIQALIELVAKFAKRFCNLITLFAMISITPTTKHNLKRGVYRPLLYQKAAIESLRLKLSYDHSHP